MNTDGNSNRLTCLITGASGGIGWELAAVCARAGHDLILTARRADELTRRADELSKAHGIRAQIAPVDLSAPGAPAELAQVVRSRGLRVDALVNNAGVALHGAFADSDLDRQLALLRLNIEAMTCLTRLLLPDMLQRSSGRIMNVASVASFMPGPLLATYFASKAYVLSFSRALSEELRGTGVTVTALVAGPTRTGFAPSAGLERTKAFRGGVMQAPVVAEIAYRAMMRGRPVVVAGWRNRLRLLPLPFVPAGVLARFARIYHEVPLDLRPVSATPAPGSSRAAREAGDASEPSS